MGCRQDKPCGHPNDCAKPLTHAWRSAIYRQTPGDRILASSIGVGDCIRESWFAAMPKGRKSTHGVMNQRAQSRGEFTKRCVGCWIRVSNSGDSVMRKWRDAWARLKRCDAVASRHLGAVRSRGLGPLCNESPEQAKAPRSKSRFWVRCLGVAVSGYMQIGCRLSESIYCALLTQRNTESKV